jgi:2-methylisocitrate lyase-like PEP mutase family enzyme
LNQFRFGYTGHARSSAVNAASIAASAGCQAPASTGVVVAAVSASRPDLLDQVLR